MARAGGRHEAARVRGQAEGGGLPRENPRREEGVVILRHVLWSGRRERRGGSILHRGGLQHRTGGARCGNGEGAGAGEDRRQAANGDRLVHQKVQGRRRCFAGRGGRARERRRRRPRRRRAILVARHERHVAFAGSIASGRPRRRRARGVAGARPVPVARSIGLLRRLEIRGLVSQRRDALGAIREQHETHAEARARQGGGRVEHRGQPRVAGGVEAVGRLRPPHRRRRRAGGYPGAVETTKEARGGDEGRGRFARGEGGGGGRGTRRGIGLGPRGYRENRGGGGGEGVRRGGGGGDAQSRSGVGRRGRGRGTGGEPSAPGG